MDRRRKVLVMGASGNVGACVTRQLVERGDDVRVLLRRSSTTKGIDGVEVERCYGDIFDTEAVTAAMADRDVVFYCVVDTRAHLADPAPLFSTNVEGLRNVLDVAVNADLQRFVFLSTIGTIAVGDDGATVDEDTPFNWAGKGGPYIESRRQAEDLVLSYARERGLPAVAMCVSTTYGGTDWGRTPHGAVIAGAAFGKLPFVMSGIDAESVGIDDAAKALILAADRGTPGERYLISEKMISNAEVARLAAEAAGVAPPQRSIPLALSYVMAAAGTLKGRLRGTDEQLSLESLRLMRAEAELDHSKAVRELGWQPRPVEESIAEAAKFWVGLRAAKRARKSS